MMSICHVVDRTTLSLYILNICKTLINQGVNSCVEVMNYSSQLNGLPRFALESCSWLTI